MSDLPTTSARTAAADDSNDEEIIIDDDDDTEEEAPQNGIDATIDELTTAQSPTFQTDEEEAARICVETIVNLLTDPNKMCQLLKLTDFSNAHIQDAKAKGEKTLPEIVVELRKAFSDKTVLARAARHFQNITDDSLYYLTALVPTTRDMDQVLKTVIEETHCMTVEGLEKLIQYLCDLIAETVPKRFRLDKMLSMTEEELEEAEKLLPPFEGDFNREDWLAVLQNQGRAGSYKIFDSSNISIQQILKEFAASYQGRITQELWNCSKDPSQYRVSDSPYQKGYSCADAVDYEKIYTFLGTLAGCRHVGPKDINKMDAAVVANIFQEMEEVIALNFDTLARQMPILREQMKNSESAPDTGFKEEDVAEIEANPLHFPQEFRNPFELEMKRRRIQEQMDNPEGCTDENGFNVTEEMEQDGEEEDQEE